MATDSYLAKTEALLREGRLMLDGVRASVEKASAEARMVPIDGHRRLKELEVRYADLSRRFEQLRVADAESIAEVKAGIEGAWNAFRSGIGSKP